MAKVIGGDKLAAFMNKIKSLNGDVKVGYFEGDKYAKRTYKIAGKQVEAGEVVPVSYVARVMEYGCTQTVTPKQRKFLHAIGFHLSPDTKTLHIPPRPFLRKTFEENHENYKSLFADILVQYDYDITKPLNVVGMRIRDDIKKAIRAITKPKNHPFTIEQKGFDKPLKGKGSSILQKSVKHEVFHK